MEPLSPYEDLELDNDCSIVLELSKEDPLFEKKMKLLKSKGFNSKERINFKSHMDPDFVTITLKVMLQIARIINLDEVELYFGEDGISSPDDPYSPRNELQALTSILRLIEISPCSSTQIQKDLLQKLHDAIIDVKDAGRGAIAREDLKVGDTALEIPASLIISEELVCESDMYHVLKKIEGISSETMLLLWSMKEKHNCNSKFKKYFATLPEEFHTGFSFGLEAKMALSDTLLFEEIIQANNHLRAQYDELFPILCKEHPDIFPPELYTWEQFLWACELWYSNSMKIMFADGKLRTCLIPVASFFNHSLYPHIVHYGRVDSATNSLKFCLSRPCSAGEECFLSYGNFSSSHLITFYGFVPEGHNPYDIFPLEFEDGTCHMVRATWLSRNNHIFHYGLPTPLLDYLRRLKSPILNTKTLLQGNLENEIEVLEDLLFMFNDLMENLGDADIDDGIETSWDVKLAIKFKDIHRGIVSSVLTSCYKGIKLLKIELSKCMEEDIRG